MNVDNAVKLMTELAIKSEGLYLKPYLCPSGVPTIGIGATFYKDGTRVTLKDSAITREQAIELLCWMIKTKFLPAVIELCPSIETDGQLAAITDFSFNLGIAALRSSTLRKRINSGDWDDVPTQLRKWVNGGGRRLNGLVIRREAEIDLINRHKEY